MARLEMVNKSVYVFKTFFCFSTSYVSYPKRVGISVVIDYEMVAFKFHRLVISFRIPYTTANKPKGTSNDIRKPMT